MSDLKKDMSHDEAAAHLRDVVAATMKYETLPLVKEAKFFGAMRLLTCEIDYIAALHEGWDGKDPRKISTAAKFRALVENEYSRVTGDQAYKKFGGHLYDMYRVGTVHLRHPKQLTNPSASTKILSWGIMQERIESFDYPKGGTAFTGAHLQPVKVSATKSVLPVSLMAIYEDTLAVLEDFAERLTNEKKKGGGKVLLGKWRSTANALVAPVMEKRRLW
jgi:hypothetical protein